MLCCQSASTAEQNKEEKPLNAIMTGTGKFESVKSLILKIYAHYRDKFTDKNVRAKFSAQILRLKLN